MKNTSCLHALSIEISDLQPWFLTLRVSLACVQTQTSTKTEISCEQVGGGLPEHFLSFEKTIYALTKFMQYLSFKMAQHLIAKFDELKFEDPINTACKFLAVEEMYKEQKEALRAFFDGNNIYFSTHTGYGKS